MVHEISQFDIPDRQLLATNAQPRVDMWMDIGEAKITRTIFGRAKVRVIRERDKKRRAWLLTALAVTVLAVAAWQGWIASQQQSEPLAVPPPLSSRIRVSAPAFQPEDITLPVTPPSVRNNPRTPSQIVFDNMTTRREPAPQQPLGLKGEQMAAKPVKSQPLIASKPQTASLATNNNSSMNQTDMQQLPKLSDPIQPVVPTVEIAPATQPAANRPPAVAPLAEPLIKGDTPTPSPAGDNQPPDPDNAQPQVNARGTPIIYVQPQATSQP